MTTDHYPPLPEPAIDSVQNDSTMRFYAVRSYSSAQMRAYVEADRKARATAEPTDWNTHTINQLRADVLKKHGDQDGVRSVQRTEFVKGLARAANGYGADALRQGEIQVFADLLRAPAAEPTAEASPVGLVPKGQRLNEILDASGFKETTVLQRTCLYALLLIEAQDELRRRAALSGVAENKS